LLKVKSIPYEKLFHFTDLAVTIQSLAGIAKQENQDGIDQWSQLNEVFEEGEEIRDTVIYHIDKSHRKCFLL